MGNERSWIWLLSLTGSVFTGNSIYSWCVEHAPIEVWSCQMLRWSDLACLFAVLLGIVLFLYGANYYSGVVGWSGVFLFVGGILAWTLIYVYGRLTRKALVQNP